MARISKDDYLLSAEQLDCRFNPEGDGEYPTFSRAAWRQEVNDESTVSGYWDWVSHRLIELQSEREVVAADVVRALNNLEDDTFTAALTTIANEIRDLCRGVPALEQCDYELAVLPTMEWVTHQVCNRLGVTLKPF